MVQHHDLEDPRSPLPMPEPDHTRRYEIRVRGRLGPMLMEAFPDLSAGHGDDETLLSGTLADQGALLGVLSDIDGLGLDLLEVRVSES
jgi:hypothetical protein